MDCPRCGAENYDDAAFCTLCYTKFGVSQPAGTTEAGSSDSARITPTEGIVGPKRPAGHGLAGKTGAPSGMDVPSPPWTSAIPPFALVYWARSPASSRVLTAHR